MKNHSLIFRIGVILVLAIVFSSCSQQKSSEYGRMPSSGAEMEKEGLLSVSDSAAPSPESSISNDVQTPSVSGRKLVYTGDMSLEVQDLNAAESFVVNVTKKAGGYVASRSGDIYRVYLVLRIPALVLESGMSEITEAGKVLSRSMSADDVTDQFFDLEGRLRNKRILEERYRDYLRQAKTIVDMLEVEKRLSETTTEIESLEGSFRDLSKRIEYSTLTVSLGPERSDYPLEPGLIKMIRDLFLSFGRAMKSALVVVVAVILFGIPLLACVAFFWYLFFGKLGLLKKLFIFVNGKK